MRWLPRALLAALACLVFGTAAAQDVSLAQLPPEAGQTIARIEAGGPFAYPQDGSVFGNRERLLPLRERGYYREYTVPTPGARDRGARRIVTGGGQYWYSDDHYRTFSRIRK